MNDTKKALASLAVTAALLVAACGGRDSVASRSAAAYDQAKKEGVAVGGGHEHGGHAAPATAPDAGSEQMPEMDHSKMQGGSMPGMDHSKMQHGSASAMDHSNMPGGSMTGMDHSKMQHGPTTATDHSKMQHGSTAATDHSKMQHGSTAATDHSTMQHGSTPGTDHSKMQSGSMPGMDHSKMQHGSTTATDHSNMQHDSTTAMDHSKMPHDVAPALASPVAIPAEAVRAGNPAAALATDSFDAPSPISVAEAVKAANNIPDGDIRHVVPGQDDENRPTPMPAIRDGSVGRNGHSLHGQAAAPAPAGGTAGHAGHGGAATSPPATPQAAVYSCPMHPEVTSDKPGTCPKCGMALVKKK